MVPCSSSPSYFRRVKKPAPQRPVERLFPFVLRSRNLIVGRETLARSRRRLHFVLITSDLSAGSREEILRDFRFYPVVQRYTSAELEQFFGIKGAKVIGFQKSGLAQSLYAELKDYRLNRPKSGPGASHRAAVEGISSGAASMPNAPEPGV